MRLFAWLAVVGFALAGCGQTKSAEDANGADRGAAPISAPDKIVPGRYTIIHSPQVERDTMLIDTASGDTWQLVSLGNKDTDGMGWQFVGKIDQPPIPIITTTQTPTMTH